MKYLHTTLGLAAALIVPTLAVAALNIPHIFESGEVISSSEVNANFEAVGDETDTLEARLANLEARAEFTGPVFENGCACASPKCRFGVALSMKPAQTSK